MQESMIYKKIDELEKRVDICRPEQNIMLEEEFMVNDEFYRIS